MNTKLLTVLMLSVALISVTVQAEEITDLYSVEELKVVERCIVLNKLIGDNQDEITRLEDAVEYYDEYLPTVKLGDIVGRKDELFVVDEAVLLDMQKQHNDHRKQLRLAENVKLKLYTEFNVKHTQYYNKDCRYYIHKVVERKFPELLK